MFPLIFNIPSLTPLFLSHLEPTRLFCFFISNSFSSLLSVPSAASARVFPLWLDFSNRDIPPSLHLSWACTPCILTSPSTPPPSAFWNYQCLESSSLMPCMTGMPVYSPYSPWQGLNCSSLRVVEWWRWGCELWQFLILLTYCSVHA